MAFWNIDYDTRKTILRVLTIGAGLFAIIPVELGPIMNYQLLGFLFPRMVFGAAAILFAVGSFKKWW